VWRANQQAQHRVAVRTRRLEARKIERRTPQLEELVAGVDARARAQQVGDHVSARLGRPHGKMQRRLVPWPRHGAHEPRETSRLLRYDEHERHDALPLALLEPCRVVQRRAAVAARAAIWLGNGRRCCARALARRKLTEHGRRAGGVAGRASRPEYRGDVGPGRQGMATATQLACRRRRVGVSA